MATNTTFDKIKEQEWFQQLSNSYQQLTPDQQNYVKWGSLGSGFLLGFYLIFSVIQSANTAKTDYYQKQELAQVLTQANDEIRRLKGQNAGFAQGTPQTWLTVFQGLASLQGLPPDSIEILKESPGAAQNVIQETLLEVKVKSAPIRQLVQMLYTIDHGSPPMKLKGLIIESSAAEGLLNAKLNISGYMAKPEKTEKAK